MPSKPEVPAGGAGKPSAPYPIGNGTHPALPTGFKTSAIPKPTPVVPQPEESSLPYFSFATPAASKTPSVESEVPYMPSSVETPAASKTPAGGDYPAYPAETPAASSPVKPAETPKESSTPVYVKPTPTPSPAGEGSYGSGYGTY
jgi:hypothetical protein